VALTSSADDEDAAGILRGKSWRAMEALHQGLQYKKREFGSRSSNAIPLGIERRLGDRRALKGG